MFSLSLLIIPPAQQKDPLNSGCAHDISIVVGASLAARPGAEKLRLDKNKEETLVGTRQKEEALCIPSPSSIWKQILFPSPADFFCLGVMFHSTHFFKKNRGCLILSYHRLSAHAKVYFIAAELGVHSTRFCFRAPPPTQNRHISQSNFQNNSLMLFPSRRKPRLVFVLL